MDPRDQLMLAVTIACRTVVALQQGITASDTTVDGQLVARALAFVRHRTSLDRVDEAVAETRDRLSRSGRTTGDLIQAGVDWAQLIYPVLREGHQPPEALRHLLDAESPALISLGRETAAAHRTEVLSRVALIECLKAKQRGDQTAAESWWHLHRNPGDPDAAPPVGLTTEPQARRGSPYSPPPRRTPTDFTRPYRDPRVAALLNASGLSAGYLYLGRRLRAGVALAIALALLLLAAANSASASPGLWFTIVALGLAGMTYDAWRLARPPHQPRTVGVPFPWRPAAAGALAIVLLVAGFGLYRAAGSRALDAARAAHATGDCVTAVERYEHVSARYELALSPVVPAAQREVAECRSLVRAESALASGSFSAAVEEFDRYLSRYADGPLSERARTGRAESYFQRAGNYAGDAVDAAGTEREAYYYEQALDDYAAVLADHPGTSQADAVPAAIADLYAAADLQPGCAALPMLDRFAATTGAEAVVPAIADALPEALYRCGLDRYDEEDFDTAIDHLDRLTVTYPDHPRAAAARDTLIAAEVAATKQGSPGELGQPQEVGTAPRGTTTVEIVNDSPEGLEILVSGTDSDTLTVRACPTCTVRTSLSPLLGVSCGASAAPTATLRLRPGTYDVVVRARSGARVTPYYGTWRLRSGTAYSVCFYVTELFRPGR